MTMNTVTIQIRDLSAIQMVETSPVRNTPDFKFHPKLKLIGQNLNCYQVQHLSHCLKTGQKIHK